VQILYIGFESRLKKALIKLKIKLKNISVGKKWKRERKKWKKKDIKDNIFG
jgi:hypothetical protein